MVERQSSVLDLTYAALADPTRREILHRLRHAEARVTDIARPLPMSLAAVSKHIGVLERAGLVRREVRGRDHYLSAAPERLTEAERWIAEYTGFWEQRADALVAHLEEHVGGGADGETVDEADTVDAVTRVDGVDGVDAVDGESGEKA